ncbi:hypothetical protein LCGC14_0970490 [marine sediment metagenome]|uniref:Uncharacterized protein n=1 Tax=marine sediment metagenome TaxID=412755 RepID=A0A0F9NGA0_9ZZZZ
MKETKTDVLDAMIQAFTENFRGSKKKIETIEYWKNRYERAGD